MRNVSSDLQNILDYRHAIENYTQVIMEIEVNGYYDYSITSPPSLDEDIFPEESVLRSRRPNGGLPKFIGNESVLVSKDITDTVYTKDRSFYRVATEDSSYKYYRTEERSAESAPFSFQSPLEFAVEYDRTISCNNLVLGFEYANSLPEEVEVFFLSDDGEESWQSAGVYVPTPLKSYDGEDVFYDFQGAGKVYLGFDGSSWSEGYKINEEVFYTKGVKIVVSAMQDPKSALEIIQISPRIAVDLSDRVTQCSTNFTRESVELSSPVGIMTSSTAAINLDNSDGIFNNENEESPYYLLIDVNVKFTINDVFVVGDTEEVVSSGIFYANSWNIDSDGTVGIDSSGYGKFLQNRPIDNCFYDNEDIRFVIADILEKAGVTDYEIRYTPEDSKTRVPLIFFESEYTVWDSLQSLASAEQAVFYFDDNGKFIWESRDYLWLSDGEEPEASFVFRANDDESGLSNFIKYSYSHDLIANKSLVYVTPTDFAKRGEELINNFIWQTTEDTVLIASPVISVDNEKIIIREEDFDLLPDEGILNIDAEFISYTKPEEDESKELLIEERGLFGSEPKEHFISEVPGAWNLQVLASPQTPSGTVAGYRHITDSKLVLTSTVSDINNVVKYETGTVSDKYSVYGAEITFPVVDSDLVEPSYNGDGIGGIFIHSNSSTTGYFFEVMMTEYATLEQNKKREARIWKYDQNGNIDVLVGFYPEDLFSLEEEELREQVGEDVIIFPGAPFKLAVFYEPFTKIVNGSPVNTANLVFSVNGKRIVAVEDNTFSQGKWGVYVRGQTEAEFEYVYAIRNVNDIQSVDDEKLAKSQIAVRDQINGGFIDNVLESFFTRFNQKRNFFFFDDFGAWAREVREFDVKYEMKPSVTSEIFMSNESNAYIVYHSRDQFSSKFAIGNRRRELTILQGNDPRVQASMTLAIYGTPVIQKEKNEVRSEDEKSIWRRGPEEIIVDTPWIQTDDHGERASDWFTDRWSRPLEVVNVDSFTDPRVELGDLVAINAPSLNIVPETHKFHVISIDENKGPENSVTYTLRRAFY